MKDEVREALEELVDFALRDAATRAVYARRDVIEAALSSCACGEQPVARGWLNYMETDDGTGLHLRLYLHDDPDERPDDTELVVCLPTEEAS